MESQPAGIGTISKESNTFEACHLHQFDSRSVTERGHFVEVSTAFLSSCSKRKLKPMPMTSLSPSSPSPSLSDPEKEREWDNAVL